MSEKRQRGCWVRLAGMSGAAAWRWVAEAEPITLPGWGSLALYLHRDLTDSEYWSITEVSSGSRLGWGPTRKDVITRATQRLAWKGLAKVQAAIAAVLESNGPPPERPQSSQGVNAQAVLDVRGG